MTDGVAARTRLAGRFAYHAYDEKRQAVLSRIDRVSKPGRRVTYACDDIPKVLNGLEVIVLTTLRGLMTDRAARKARVGGEALCAVC